MSLVTWISRWAEQRSSWALLFLTALALEITALYFQYGMDLRPCIQCIYQRTAMYGIVLAGLLVLLVNHSITRFGGFALWAVSAIWGFMLASEHIDILYASNPFFSSCSIVPNFPTWAPLHEWIPSVFAATGDCTEDSWKFMSMGMAQWMQIIFGIYTAVFVIVFGSRLLVKKPF